MRKWSVSISAHVSTLKLNSCLGSEVCAPREPASPSCPEPQAGPAPPPATTGSGLTSSTFRPRLGHRFGEEARPANPASRSRRATEMPCKVPSDEEQTHRLPWPPSWHRPVRGLPTSAQQK